MLSRRRLDGPTCSLDLVPISMCPRLGTRLVLPGSHGVNLYLAYSVKSGTALAVPTVPVPAVPAPQALPIALEDRFCGSKKGGMEWGGGGGVTNCRL